MTDREIEQKLTLLAAGDPKTETAQLMLRAADVISRLRSEVNYERARADLNNNTFTDAERPLGDPEIAVEILKLRVAELEEAIRRLADQDATLSVVGGNVIVEMDATLTDAERQVIAWAADIMSDASAATLRGLLERTKGGEQ